MKDLVTECKLHRHSTAHEVYCAGNPTLNSHVRPEEAEAPKSLGSRVEKALRVPQVDSLLYRNG